MGVEYPAKVTKRIKMRQTGHIQFFTFWATELTLNNAIDLMRGQRGLVGAGPKVRVIVYNEER